MNNRLVKKIGFLSLLCSALFYIAFDIAAILNISDIFTSKYWISIFYYTPSIFLALSFVVMMVSIHYYSLRESKICSHIGLVLSGSLYPLAAILIAVLFSKKNIPIENST